ncbi:hypothetical protein SAMN05192583_0897 [Sphingomonas gellani]|uniref:Uncharacterized protein n=1 Tax=Sphingomonas gellani TaxID=1166340 RepID=A0A1H7ZZE7_9SPHN|nr:hypothetical protein [Sphingomonas gellani]SEM63084.1 hypothetical protein SAMN05192583_0897 [Sphingomonas gellani]
MIAVIYDPADGRIIQTVRGTERSIALSGPAYIEVPEFRADYDATHQVIDGTLQPRED